MKYLKKVLVTIAIPVLTYLFFLIICNAKTPGCGFGMGSDLQTIIYNTLYTGMIALAMSYNLTTGRFDFSVGATILLGVLFGGNVAKNMGLNTGMMLLMIILFCVIFGFISGLLYVLLKIPPMVSSIGLALIYESFGFMVNKGKGVSMIGDSRLVYSKTPYSIIMVVVAIVVLFIVFNYTKFGYHWRMLQSGQKTSVDMGINEKRNAILCYIIAGALLGIAAALYLSKYGKVSAEMGLGSSSMFMSAFLPIFVGGAIEKYSDKNIGLMMGAITQACITSGFSKLGLNASLQTVLNGVIVMALLVYTSNSYKLTEAKMFREKKALAQSAASGTGA